MEQLKAIMFNVIAGLITAGILAASTRASWLLINLAALFLPRADRQSLRNEWLANLNDFEGQLERLRHAVSCLRSVVDVRKALEERARSSPRIRTRDNIIYLSPSSFRPRKPPRRTGAWAFAMSVLLLFVGPAQISEEVASLTPQLSPTVPLASPSPKFTALRSDSSTTASPNSPVPMTSGTAQTVTLPALDQALNIATNTVSPAGQVPSFTGSTSAEPLGLAGQSLMTPANFIAPAGQVPSFTGSTSAEPLGLAGQSLITPANFIAPAGQVPSFTGSTTAERLGLAGQSLITPANFIAQAGQVPSFTGSTTAERLGLAGQSLITPANFIAPAGQVPNISFFHGTSLSVQNSSDFLNRFRNVTAPGVYAPLAGDCSLCR